MSASVQLCKSASLIFFAGRSPSAGSAGLWEGKSDVRWFEGESWVSRMDGLYQKRGYQIQNFNRSACKIPKRTQKHFGIFLSFHHLRDNLHPRWSSCCAPQSVQWPLPWTPHTLSSVYPVTTNSLAGHTRPHKPCMTVVGQSSHSHGVPWPQAQSWGNSEARHSLPDTTHRAQWQLAAAIHQDRRSRRWIRTWPVWQPPLPQTGFTCLRLGCGKLV